MGAAFSQDEGSGNSSQRRLGKKSRKMQVSFPAGRRPCRDTAPRIPFQKRAEKKSKNCKKIVASSEGAYSELLAAESVRSLSPASIQGCARGGVSITHIHVHGANIAERLHFINKSSLTTRKKQRWRCHLLVNSFRAQKEE